MTIKTVLVTGTSRGLGFALAKCLLKDHYSVIGISRTLPIDLVQDSKYEHHLIDVSDKLQLENLFKKLVLKNVALHGVVHAAGVYGPFGAIEDSDAEAWEYNVKVNLFGTYYILKEVAKIFRKQEFGNFVAISGGGATNPMPRITAYASSKSALVRLVESVAVDFHDLPVSFNSVAPGLMDTAMLDELIAAGPEKVGKEFFQKMQKFKQNGEDSQEMAISLICKLLSLSNGKPTGKLISAIWDNWEKLLISPDYLNNYELHTLRRKI